jgi:hypothetical protein
LLDQDNFVQDAILKLLATAGNCWQLLAAIEDICSIIYGIIYSMICNINHTVLSQH